MLSAQNAPLRDRLNQILLGAMRDGTLERIFRTWSVWNDDQPALYARLLAGEQVAPLRRSRCIDGGRDDASMGCREAVFPVAASRVARHIVLSCLSMALAVLVGVLIATGRVYGGRVLRVVLVAYVELIRGTPILLQLFVLYYGLAVAIRLPAFVAALLGPGAELCGVRERDLPLGARSDSRPASSRRRVRSG